MSDPKPTDSQPNSDLTSTDAQAFVSANNLVPDEPVHPVDPSKPGDQITHAVDEALIVRAASSKPRPLIFYVATAIAIVGIIALGLSISFKQKTTAGASNPNSGVLSVPTPDSSATKGLDKQTQQEINTCSQVTNTALGKC